MLKRLYFHPTGAAKPSNNPFDEDSTHVDGAAVPRASTGSAINSDAMNVDGEPINVDGDPISSSSGIDGTAHKTSFVDLGSEGQRKRFL